MKQTEAQELEAPSKVNEKGDGVKQALVWLGTIVFKQSFGVTQRGIGIL